MKKYLVSGLLLLVLLILGVWPGLRLYWLKQPTGSFPLTLEWQTDLGRLTYEGPAYQNGLVVMPAEGVFKSYWYGINAASGRTIWQQPARRFNFRRCLTSEYLVVSGPWSLFVFRTPTGEIVWEGEEGWSATCDGGLVFTGAPTFSIDALEISTGRAHWLSTVPPKTFHGLVYNSEADEIVASETNVPGDLYAVDSKSGVILRSFKEVDFPPYEEWRGSMYLIDQGQLFLGATVLDARTGEVLHKEDRFSALVPPTLTEDTMYISTYHDGVVALDREAFNIQWVYQPPRKVQWEPVSPLSEVALLNGIGYAVFSDVTLRAFDLETGRELGFWQPGLTDLWSWPVCQPLPVIGCTRAAKAGLATSDETLFVSFGDGKLYAFGQR